MKFGYDEIKRKIYILAAVLFVVIAGIIFMVKKNNSNVSDNSINTYDIAENTVAEGETADETASESSAEDTAKDKTPDNTSGKIVVYVCGAVEVPGLYELDPTDRIGDAINAAGGFSKNAVQDYLNLAETLYDGEKITVYTKKQIKKMSDQESEFQNGNTADNNSSDSPDDRGTSHVTKININSASKNELMTLPGIGESKADAIISYRDNNGLFGDIKEIMNISGIKEGVFSKIESLITI